MKKFGSSLVGGAKAVASAQKSVAGAVVEGGKSAYSSVVDAKGDPSSRCYVMVKEAAAYRDQLVRAEKDLKGLLAAAEAALGGSRAVLDSPLPRVHQQAVPPGGAAQPAENAGGAAFSGAALLQAKADLAARLQAESFQPLQHWQARFKDAEANQKALNKLFAEWESLVKKVEAQRAKTEELRLKQGSGDAKAQEKYADAVKKLAQLEGALKVTNEEHAREEAAQFERLVPLVKEAAQLRGWLKSALSAVGTAFAAAAGAVPSANPCVQGLSVS